MKAKRDDNLSYEVELKCLLDDKRQVEELKKKLAKFESWKEKERSEQLNHYFLTGDVEGFYEKIASLLLKSKRNEMRKAINAAEKVSFRTRKLNDQVILYLKASVDETTSENGISRIEVEVLLPELTLEELDRLLLESGFEYQAKWSRKREEYRLNDVNVCFDYNAGYGWLVELEKVVDKKHKVDEARKRLRRLIKKIGLKELDQGRLERMFVHYNDNWQKYYGTEKTFIIE